jgi:hypothetical protein
MTMPREIGTDELALLLGIDDRSVRRLVRKGVFVRGALGFDVADSVQRFVAHRESIIAEKAGSGEFGKARSQLYVERARKMQLEREELAGKLLRVTDVIAFMTAIVGVTKQRALALPSKYAPRLVGLKTAGEIAALLTQGIREMLEDLCNAKVVAIRPSRRTTRKDAA